MNKKELHIIRRDITLFLTKRHTRFTTFSLQKSCYQTRLVREDGRIGGGLPGFFSEGVRLLLLRGAQASLRVAFAPHSDRPPGEFLGEFLLLSWSGSPHGGPGGDTHRGS